MKAESSFDSRTSREMTRVLVGLGIIPEGARVRVVRCYAGRNQRAAGAWSWYAEDDARFDVCGSQWSARTIIRYWRDSDKHISWREGEWDLHLYPEEGPDPTHEAEA